MRYGIETIGPQFWNGEAPELAVAGPNVGSNLYLAVHFSGTVGAAVYAAKEAKIPAIAFSGASHGTLAWNASPEAQRSKIYAELATTFTNAVVASGKPYLPEDVFLNVNFPEVSDQCTEASQFKWVLSRINIGVFSDRDVKQCGQTRLPAENSVVGNKGGCYISVSVGNANDKTTASAEKQAVVLNKLQSLFTCLP
jgi:broad specificity polyphosphatase/5'/3'-nucleotidase SurE